MNKGEYIMPALMKLCKKCVKWTDKDVSYCPICGNRLIEAKLSNVYWNKISTEEKDKYTKEYLNDNGDISHQQTTKISVPKVRPFWNAEYTLALMSCAISIPVFILIFQYTFDLFMFLIGLIFIFIGIGLAITGRDKLNKRQEIYDKYKNSPEQYSSEIQKVVKREQEFSESMAQVAKMEKAWKEEEKRAAKNIKINCPICGSTNVQRISDLNRAVSVGTMGLASSKIGKQYECKKCKHKW